MTNDRLEELADRLDALAEELAELAVDRLREAVRSGAVKRPDQERRLTQARRAVEKAAHALRSAADEAGAEADAGG